MKEQKDLLGFTLIELLVVIAIIGLLSSMAVFALNNARIKGRDSKRISDLKQIGKALELYYNDNGQYPITSGWATSESTTSDSGATKWAGLETSLSSYVSTLPGDPNPSGTSGPWSTGNLHYAYRSTEGYVYDLIAQLENEDSEYTCENQCWNYHYGEGTSPDTPWCGVSTSCSGTFNFSPYIFADH